MLATLYLIKLGITIEEAMSKWKSLRDHFVRELKRSKKYPYSKKIPS